ncbi:MAG: phage baseplate protein [Cyanobacteria bacterium J06598_1]
MTLPAPSLCQALSSAQIIRLWEVGQPQHPIDRALSCLTVALPSVPPKTLRQLSIGQRDAYLLRLRERTFGAQMASLASCPHCQEQIEFELSTTDLQVAPLADLSQPYSPAIYATKTEHESLRFRLPNSEDLATVATLPDADTARRQLAQRCLIQPEKPAPEETQNQGQGAASSFGLAAAEEISEWAIAHLSEQISQADPQAEILLNLDCPACGHQWQILFDIVSFFWRELTAQAHRLMRDVHRLARFYGWREADILSMSHTRRQYYLELVS